MVEAAGGSIDVALGFVGVVGDAVGGAPSVGGAECAYNPLTLESMAELEDGFFSIGRVGRVGGRCCGGRRSLEELFDVAKLSSGEVGEVGFVGDELSKDFFFVCGGHRNVVEVAVKLLRHGVVAGS